MAGRCTMRIPIRKASIHKLSRSAHADCWLTPALSSGATSPHIFVHLSFARFSIHCGNPLAWIISSAISAAAVRRPRLTWMAIGVVCLVRRASNFSSVCGEKPRSTAGRKHWIMSAHTNFSTTKCLVAPCEMSLGANDELISKARCWRS